MTDIQLAINFIFDSLNTLFGFMMSTWILSIFVLFGLLCAVVSIYRSTRNK